MFLDILHSVVDGIRVLDQLCLLLRLLKESLDKIRELAMIWFIISYLHLVIDHHGLGL